MSSSFFEHSRVDKILSMVTAFRSGNIYYDISSIERKSLQNNITLSSVTRLRYGNRSDDMSSL